VKKENNIIKSTIARLIEKTSANMRSIKARRQSTFTELSRRCGFEKQRFRSAIPRDFKSGSKEVEEKTKPAIVQTVEPKLKED